MENAAYRNGRRKTMPEDPNDTPPVTRADRDGVALLTLDRPERRNPMSEATLRALDAQFTALAADKSIRTVVIAASGRVFSAGHDLKEMSAHRGDADRGRAYFTEIMALCSKVMMGVTALPQPVIASVEGIATAAGCQLVASCDLAVASKSAKFCTPGVDIGLFCATPMVALSRSVGRKQALAMLLTGDMIPAEEAYRIGLVSHLAEPGEALGAAMTLAERIASKSGPVLALGKKAFYAQLGSDLEAAYRQSSAVMVENMLAPDAEEGIGAFLEKRPPRWSDR